MFIKLLSIVCLTLFLSACGQEQNASASLDTPTSAPTAPTITHTPTITPSPTIISSPTHTVIPPTATLIPTATSQPTNAPAPSVACTIPRTDLPRYTVSVGDTLSNIAVRADSTVTELARLNCLDDISLINVGQQLYVPESVPPSEPNSDTGSSNPRPIDITNIPTHPASRYGSISISPWIVRYQSVYVVEGNTTLSLQWANMPTNLGITQVGFVIEPNNKIGGYTLLGTDSDLANGASLAWTVPADEQVDIFAVGLVEGQAELVVSNRLKIGAKNSSDGIPKQQYGTVELSPSVQYDNPSQVVVDPNSVPITLTWLGPTAFDYRIIDNVSFYYRPDDGSGATLIGSDTDETGGISVNWTTFPTMAGVIYAEGEFVKIAPQVFHRTLNTGELRVDTLVENCQFNPFGIGGDIPVYPSPDLTTTPIDNIQMGTIYPILETGGSWSNENGGSGIFYRIDLGDKSGWIVDHRGEMIGNC